MHLKVYGVNIPKRKSYHHGDLKAQLAEAALAFLAKNGPEALSLRDLCRAIGVSPMAPYRHFQDKAALLVYLAEAGCRDLLERMTEIEKGEADPMRCLQRCAEAYVSFAREESSQFRLIFGAEMLRQAERAQAVLDMAEACIEILVRAIARAQKTGQVRGDHSARKLADIAWIAVHGHADLMLSGHQEPSPQALRLLVETLVRGIAPPVAKKR